MHRSRATIKATRECLHRWPRKQLLHGRAVRAFEKFLEPHQWYCLQLCRDLCKAQLSASRTCDKIIHHWKYSTKLVKGTSTSYHVAWISHVNRQAFAAAYKWCGLHLKTTRWLTGVPWQVTKAKACEATRHNLPAWGAGSAWLCQMATACRTLITQDTSCAVLGFVSEAQIQMYCTDAPLCFSMQVVNLTVGDTTIMFPDRKTCRLWAGRGWQTLSADVVCSMLRIAGCNASGNSRGERKCAAQSRRSLSSYCFM